MKKIGGLLLVLLTVVCGNVSAGEERMLPIQHGGRVKTFDAFAKETMTLIHGRASWQKRSATEWFYDAAAQPDAARAWKWIRVDYRPLADALGLPKDRNHFSFDEIIPSLDKIEGLSEAAEKKRKLDQTPSLLERKAEALYQSLVAAKAVSDGEAFRVIPPAQGSADPAWQAPVQSMNTDLAGRFIELAKSHLNAATAAFNQEVHDWNAQIHQMTGGRYARILSLESFYLASRPFGFAALAYLAGFLLLFSKKLRKLGTLLAMAGFAFHTLGFALRIGILGRPPVSNMYESMIWMNWVLMLAALILSAVRRDAAAIKVGAIASAIVMIYGDLLPIDSGLDVLVPVLRSNYWLTIHVLTIVSSYGLFGLAMGLGHRHLWLHTTGKLSRAEEDRSAHLVYRTIQVGVLLLGIGTVLGGVWANESWGRFWGWDPKETWALITFLGYLVLIHLHFARVVKPFALAVSSIVGFLLVLFTWYGVNFVLGKGLHSYGQGSGGMNWILFYLGAEAVFAAWVFTARPVRRAR